MYQVNKPPESAPTQQEPRISPRDHLANERTLLAWSRTGIAVIALGFVVARFGLLLRELGRTTLKQQVPVGTSAVFGVAIVIAGAVLMLLSLLRYLRTGKAIENQQYAWSPFLGAALTVSLIVVGVLLAIYLILTA